MESFSGFFSGVAFNGDEPVALYIQILVLSQVAGIFLLFLRRAPLKWFLLTGLFAVLTYSFILPKDSVLSFLGFLPYRIQTFSLDTWAIILGWVIGFALLLYAARKKTRSLQRIVVSVSLIMMCSLMYGYHILIIQGAMKASMMLQEQKMLEVIGFSDERWVLACEIGGYECSSGENGSKIIHPEKEIEKQLSDYIGYYRQAGSDAILFTMSKGLVVKRTPFASAFLEDDQGYRLMVDRRSAQVYFLIAENSFNIIANLAMFFWFFGGIFVIVAHEKMMAKRLAG